MLKKLALLLIVCAAAVPFIVARTGSVAPEYDTAIINGRIEDGTGNPWFYGSVAVKDDRIVKVGLVDPRGAAKVIDARGMVIAPADRIAKPASRASSVTSCLPSPSGQSSEEFGVAAND